MLCSILNAIERHKAVELISINTAMRYHFHSEILQEVRKRYKK